MDYIRKERNVTYHSDACKMYLRHDFGHKCAYCGIIEEAHFINPLVADDGFEKDHFYPQNGTGIEPLPAAELHAYPNLFYSCSKCNNLKDNVLLPLNPCENSIFSGDSPYIRIVKKEGDLLAESDQPEGNAFIAQLDLNSRHHIELRKEQDKWQKVMLESSQTLKAISASGSLSPDAISVLEEALNLRQTDEALGICGGSSYGLSIREVYRYLDEQGYDPKIVFEEQELDVQITIEETTYLAKVYPLNGASYCKIKTSVLSEWQKRNMPCGILRFQENPMEVRFYCVDFDSVSWDKLEYRIDNYISL